MHELKVVRDYEEGRVTKEQLDACSTCDMCAKINSTTRKVLLEKSVKELGCIYF